MFPGPSGGVGRECFVGQSPHPVEPGRALLVRAHDDDGEDPMVKDRDPAECTDAVPPEPFERIAEDLGFSFSGRVRGVERWNRKPATSMMPPTASCPDERKGVVDYE